MCDSLIGQVKWRHTSRTCCHTTYRKVNIVFIFLTESWLLRVFSKSGFEDKLKVYRQAGVGIYIIFACIVVGQTYAFFFYYYYYYLTFVIRILWNNFVLICFPCRFFQKTNVNRSFLYKTKQKKKKKHKKNKQIENKQNNDIYLSLKGCGVQRLRNRVKDRWTQPHLIQMMFLRIFIQRINYTSSESKFLYHSTKLTMSEIHGNDLFHPQLALFN